VATLRRAGPEARHGPKGALDAGSDGNAIAAWRDWLKARTGFVLEARREQRTDDAGRPVMRRIAGLNGDIDVPAMREIIAAPARWPPRRDGTFAADEQAGTEKSGQAA
jgi:hypothetical protein